MYNFMTGAMTGAALLYLYIQQAYLCFPNPLFVLRGWF